MDYLKEYRRFITSHYLSDGLRITFGIALPAILLGYFGFLSHGIAISLGAMCASTTDIPGPIHHRRNGMMVCILAVLITAFLTILASPFEWPTGVLIAAFCFVYCMIGIYGARANSVGVAALLIMVLSLEQPMTNKALGFHLIALATGGVWFMLLSLVLYGIRPYKLVQQVLGEYILNTSAYLRIRALFYGDQVNYDEVYRQLLEQQVKVEQSQHLVNELLFKNRTLIKESILTGRVLMMIQLDVLDLFEKVITSFEDYKQLHESFKNTGILQKYQAGIYKIADALDEIGIAVQGGYPAKEEKTLQQSVQQLKKEFEEFRNTRHNAENLEGLISLRQILQSIEDIAARISILQLYTTYDKKKIKNADNPVSYTEFTHTQAISWQLLKDNLTFRSNTFRHAVRVSIAAVSGFIISRFLPIGHSYWILLTIIVILKPTYSLTQKRNFQRLWGTVCGALLALVLLYTIDNRTALFVCLIVLMIGTYSFLRSNYFIGVLFTTAWVLVLFQLVYDTNMKTIFTERLVDTAIGSAIAFLANFLIVPAWEKEKIRGYMLDALEKNTSYFKNVSAAFLDKPVPVSEYKKSRQHAFVSLANLSDAFTRMLNEPKFIRNNSQQIHRFVVLNHTLTSHVATLAHYVSPSSSRYASPDFTSIIETNTRLLQDAKSCLSNEPATDGIPVTDTHIINERLNNLLEKRKQELDQKQFHTETRKQLSELKPVVDQFNMISAIARDLKKICKEINV